MGIDSPELQQFMKDVEERMYAAVGRLTTKHFYAMMTAIVGGAVIIVKVLLLILSIQTQVNEVKADSLTRLEFTQYLLAHPDAGTRLDKIEKELRSYKDDTNYFNLQVGKTDSNQDERISDLENKERRRARSN